MGTRIATLLIVVGLFFTGLTLAGRLGDSHLPGNHQGYEPVQPIAFSHRLHAGELQIACQYCHNGAETGKHAGIPSGGQCLNCHKSVTAPLGTIRDEEVRAKEEGRKPARIVAPELAKLYDYLGLDQELRPAADKAPRPIPWIKVHNLPDYACFDHRAHVTAGVACQHCHGPVETMERVRQVESLSMGWCVNCHREANDKGIRGQKVKASLDCAACHY